MMIKPVFSHGNDSGEINEKKKIEYLMIKFKIKKSDLINTSYREMKLKK